MGCEREGGKAYCKHIRFGLYSRIAIHGSLRQIGADEAEIELWLDRKACHRTNKTFYASSYRGPKRSGTHS